ncbi:hypothetical protein GGI22_004166 [Coemansia erecta]|nr:hypothetical protein GGI22_004166 [Coemansia erecta]
MKSEPSYTESTRLAINQLAAFSKAHSDHLDAPIGADWTDVPPPDDNHHRPAKDDLFANRRSISYAQQQLGSERRKSEPFVTTTCTLDRSGNACSHERCLKYRMLSQRVLSHQDLADVNNAAASSSHASSPRSALGILGLQDPADDGIMVGFGAGGAAQSKPNSSAVAGLQRPMARSSEINRWQHSDTDLSLLSSGCSNGGRRLL